jgi:hypothetical protein
MYAKFKDILLSTEEAACLIDEVLAASGLSTGHVATLQQLFLSGGGFVAVRRPVGRPSQHAPALLERAA